MDTLIDKQSKGQNVIAESSFSLHMQNFGGGGIVTKEWSVQVYNAIWTIDTQQTKSTPQFPHWRKKKHKNKSPSLGPNIQISL